jgi:hypothetical protein
MRNKRYILGYEVSWNPIGYNWLWMYAAALGGSIGIGVLLAVLEAKGIVTL